MKWAVAASCCFVWSFWAHPALAQDSVRVVVGDYSGTGADASGISGFEAALGRLKGVGVEAHSTYERKAGELGLEGSLPGDPAAMIDTSAAVDVDAVLYVQLKPRGRAADLIIQVYAGRSGRVIGEHSIKVKKARPAKATWTQAARSVEADLYASLDVQAPPTRARVPDAAPIDVAQEPQPRGEEDDDEDENSSNFKMFRISAGMAFLSRTFSYTATSDSPQFASGGIQYDSALVPGVALEAEVHPLRSLAGLGLGLRFEKVFVNTEQEVKLTDTRTKTQPLETSHHHLLLRALYRQALTDGPAGIELLGGVGFGLLSFALADNDEYNGASYRYLEVVLGGYVPLGTPLVALDIQASLLPVVSLGDTVRELGEEASTLGWRVHAGVTSVFLDDFSATGGMEYTRLASEVTGSGRGGRKGKSAEDSFLGFRLMGGYRF